MACPCGQKMRVPAAPVDEPVLEAEIVSVISGIQQPANSFQQPAASFQQPAASFQQPVSPYQSPAAKASQGFGATSGAGLNDVKSGQRILILGMCIYLCSLPVLLAANVFLDHTAGKPTVTPAFGVLMVLALLGLLSAASCASFGIFRMGSVLFPGSTRYIYAVGVLVPAPLIGLLVMFVANGRATGYLKAQGVEVGFFGARG